MGEENEAFKMIIKAIDDAPIMIMYDKQQTVPEAYKNKLLSDLCLLWKGNVILGKEGSPWRLDLLKDFSWLEGVKETLLAWST